MQAFGGFDHNAQTIRIVTKLEHRYAEFDGLNLTWEMLEGIAKHNGPVVQMPRALAEYAAQNDLELGTHASLEAQVAALSDDVAYNNHDIDDGLRAGLFTVADLQEVPEVGGVFAEVMRHYPHLSQQRLIHESVRRLINRMCADLQAHSQANIALEGIETVSDVRNLGKPVIGFSPEMEDINKRLKAFLMERMYRHYQVNRMSSKARRVVKALFAFFHAEPECLPTEWRELADGAGTQRSAEVVADYIAGMTDRFALREYARVFEV
jgi:dGTPase